MVGLLLTFSANSFGASKRPEAGTPGILFGELDPETGLRSKYVMLPRSLTYYDMYVLDGNQEAAQRTLLEDGQRAEKQNNFLCVRGAKACCISCVTVHAAIYTMLWREKSE